MKNHELCPDCKPLGRCFLRERARHIANSIPPAEKQTPIKLGEKPTQEAFIAHLLIALHLAQAREFGCPNVNKVDPNYPGKNNL